MKAAADPRFRLLGKYQTPRFKYGAVVMDECRGEVTIVGITDAPISWPIGKTLCARSLVVYGDLERAIRRESNQAICYWWDVAAQTVASGARNSGWVRLRKGLFSDDAK